MSTQFKDDFKPRLAWRFTFNKYDEVDGDNALKALRSPLKYLVFGKEEGTCKHLQGYLVWKDAKSCQASLKHLPKGITLLPADADSQWNFDYCSKGLQTHEEWDEQKTNGPNYGRGADVYEWGTKPASNKRKRELASDVAEVRMAFIDRGDLKGLRAEHPAYYENNIQKILSLQRVSQNEQVPPDLDGPLKHMWITGETRSGKTTIAKRLYPKFDNIGASDAKWDSYSCAPCLILDEMETHSIDHSRLRRIFDRSPFSWHANYVGGLCRPEVVIATSQKTIEECFKGYPKVIAAMKERCLEINMDAYPYPAVRMTRTKNLRDLDVAIADIKERLEAHLAPDVPYVEDM